MLILKYLLTWLLFFSSQKFLFCSLTFSFFLIFVILYFVFSPHLVMNHVLPFCLVWMSCPSNISLFFYDFNFPCFNFYTRKSKIKQKLCVFTLLLFSFVTVVFVVVLTKNVGCVFHIRDPHIYVRSWRPFG